MKKILTVFCSVLLFGTLVFADNDIHTGELSGDYSGESHIDSVWENAYVKDGEKVIFSTSTNKTAYTRANFSGANLTSASFLDATLTNAKFTNANLSSAYFDYAILTDANFTNANLKSAWFCYATLKNTDFTDAIIKGAYFDHTVSKGFTEAQLKSTKSYKEKDLSGIWLNDNDMSGWDFSGQNLTSAYFFNANFSNAIFTGAVLSSVIFRGATLTNADFTNAIVSGTNFIDAGFTEEQLKTTKSYKERDLSGIALSLNDMSGWDFSGQNLTSAYLYGSTLSNTNFSNANLTSSNLSGATLTAANFADTTIKGADFSNTVSEGFTESQLKSTKSYKEKDLSGIALSGNDLAGWDFNGQNLQNTSFEYAYIKGADFTNADLRGANLNEIYGTPIYKNTILADGVIKNFGMASAADSLTIRKYTTATSGGEMINAKVSESDATVSGGATLKLDTGARLDIVNKKTLTIAENGVLIIDTAVSDPTQIYIESLAGLVIDGKLTVNITEALLPDVEYKFDLISFEDGSIIDIPEECVSLTVLGESFDGVWRWVKNENTFSIIATQVPEPATVAAIFGALALGLAVYRRRR